MLCLGTIPSTIGSLISITNLEMDSNKLIGMCNYSSYAGTLVCIIFQKGSIPSTIGTLTKLSIFSISGNSLYGR